jgi:hypothetical protein
MCSTSWKDSAIVYFLVLCVSMSYFIPMETCNFHVLSPKWRLYGNECHLKDKNVFLCALLTEKAGPELKV